LVHFYKRALQIFFNNMMGTSFPLDVCPTASVEDVKALIKTRKGFDPELQKLSFCGKVLMDKKTLSDFKVHHKSSIQISIQTQSPSGNYIQEREKDESFENSYDSGHDLFGSPEVDWEDMAETAKRKVDKIIERKKMQYDVILDVKMKTLEQITALKKKIERDVLAEKDLQKAVDEKDEETAILVRDVGLLQEAIRSKYQTMFKIEREKTSLGVQKDAIRKGIYEKQSRLDLLMYDIANLDENMKRIIVDENDIRAKEKAKMNEDAESCSSMKDFLNESISAKKALLECPVCFETASPPIHRCPREHLICSQCLPRTKYKCPSCRASIPKNSYSVFRIAEEIWMELQNLIQRGESL